MCIIVYKPEHVKMPKKAILESCFVNNPDGAGFMYAFNNQVIIKKGFMNFDSFYTALKSAVKESGSDAPYVLHFRISTQAGVNKQCCHPFPLSAKMSELKKLESTCKIGVAHNGVISLTSDGGKDYSDTMLFITDYLTHLIHDAGYYKHKSILTMIYELALSKFAILDASGHCELIGQFIKDSGVYYSNASYISYSKPRKSSKSNKAGFISLPTDEPENNLDDIYEFYLNCPPDAYNCAFEDTGEFCYCDLCADRERCHDYLTEVLYAK